jgi:hypothetical protein
MTRIAFATLLISSLALAGCQKAKMKAVEHPSAPAPVTSFTPPPPPPQPVVAPTPPPLPRTPDIEPRDPVVVPPPPVTVIPTQGHDPVPEPDPVVIVPDPVPPKITVTPPPPPPAPPVTPQPPPAPAPQFAQTPLHGPIPPARPNLKTVQADTCNENQPCKHIEPQWGACKPKKINVTKISKKLDILFVVDTSASLRLGPKKSREGGELPQIARQMGNFVSRLDPDTDYRIGVVLGHGPQSRYYGKLFSAGKNDPAFLDYSQYRAQEAARGGSTEQIEARVRQRISQALEKKMMSVPDDKSDAQGEALMLNLYKIAQQPKLCRKGASLAVIAVTDEQDVCYAYPKKATASDQAAFSRGEVPVLKPYRAKSGKTVHQADVHETRFFNSSYCAKAVKGRRLQSGDVSRALLALQSATGGKVIMNAIAYKSNAGLKALAGNEDENEMAH